MNAAAAPLLAATHGRDAAYDLVLLAHVLAALVGFGAVVLAGGYAWALLRSGSDAESVRRYYRPGANWAGRILFLVPVLGLALMAMSHGDWTLSDRWITIGLALWTGVALAAELVLWPAERRLQVAVERATTEGVPLDGVTAGRLRPGSAGDGAAVSRAGPAVVRSECLRVIGTSCALSAALIGTTVVMVAKP